MKRFFNFSKGEQRGIVVLLLLIVVVILLNFFIKSRPEKPANSKDVIAWEREVAEFEQYKKEQSIRYDSIRAAQKAAREAQFQSYQNRSSYHFPDDKIKKPEPDYFFFDPNTATIDEFVRLGFSKKQAEIIERYRNRGAKFKEKSDFEKVFVVSEEMFAELEPWIIIAKTENPPDSSQMQTESAQTSQFLIIELNSCDTSQLKKLKGIGNVLSQKIVDYRVKLGGYYSVEQLMDINGIDQTVFTQIEQHLTVDVTYLKKMDINKVTFKQLLQHPYFEYHIVKNIFNYKDKHGNFQLLEQMKEIPLIYEDLYNKILPYLYIRK